MKLVIASDIHGSVTWCRKLVDTIEREQPDRVLLLGDELYHGPRNDLPEGYDPKSVAAMLNGLKDRIVAVRGNCDAEVDQMVLDFPCMADYVELFDGPRRLFCTHGHIYSADGLAGIDSVAGIDGGVTGANGSANADGPAAGAASNYVPAASSGNAGHASVLFPHLVDGDVFLQGHTHIKRNELVALPDGGTARVVNPGSVSIPKDGSHSFAVYEYGTFDLRILA